MQYLLTAEEYSALQAAAARASKLPTDDELNNLAMLLARSTPRLHRLTANLVDPVEPCRHDTHKAKPFGGYCDGCQGRPICSQSKYYSK